MIDNITTIEAVTLLFIAAFVGFMVGYLVRGTIRDD